jgi:hemerythrin-like domain-containing protein
MTDRLKNRRGIVLGAGLAGTALIATPMLASCSKDKNEEKETGAVEDLMREHGVLRRAILVLRESASRLRQDVQNFDPKQIAETTKLFRTFGEDYHERKLEEAYIFPAVRKAGGPAAAYVDILIAQHNRGREITAYILAATSKGKIGAADAVPLANAFDALELMYANHTAREDTIIFPAWKNALSEGELDEMGDKFEDIEKQTFGKDGFDDAVQRMDRIEQVLGFSDLAQFTAPKPSSA